MAAWLAHSLDGWSGTVVVLSRLLAEFPEYDFFSVEGLSMVTATELLLLLSP